MAHNRVMRILIVEDDHIIASELERALRKQGYFPDVAPDGYIGLEFAFQNNYAVILLDVMLPVMNGYEVCKAIRKAANSTPILMLTAKDTTDDTVNGLDAGADDYLVKPFALPELLARIRALTRRDVALKSDTFQTHDLIVDSRTHTVTRDGKNISLTKREFTLLEALARNPGQVFSREVILERIWDNEESMPNTVNFHLASLRKKIDTPFPIKLIHTIHGVGYTLKSPE